MKKMKRDYSGSSLIQTDPIASFISPKNSRSNLFKFSHPQSGRLGKIKTYSNSTTDLSLPVFSPKLSNVKSFIEPEKLVQEKFQLRNIVRNLRKELFNLKQENLQKKNEINQKEKTILNIINNENNEIEEQGSSLMNKIRKHIKQIKQEIIDIDEKNEYLKRDNKLTKINEYLIEKEKFEEQINKIKSLIQNGKQVKINVNEKVNELNDLKSNVDYQNIILYKMTSTYENLNNEEEILQQQINEINEKIMKDKQTIIFNRNIVLTLKKRNDNLQKDKTINSRLYVVNKDNTSVPMDQSYKNKISEKKKLINDFKMKLKFSENSIQDLKKENNQLKDISKNKQKQFPNYENQLFFEQSHKSINLKSSKNKFSDDEIINKLKDTLQSSKEIEIELEKQLKIYKEKLDEINNRQNNNDQIEFGIDSDNPYFTSNENNNPIESLKISSIQFNQFTYILFKNFEAKNINLENNKLKFIEELINNANKEEEQIEEIDINSESFISIVNKFCNSISEILNCGNDYNIKMLQIFIGALLFNSGGSIVKLSEYFTVLFSYTKIYQKELENKLIDRINRKYKDKAELLLKLINEQNINDNIYISLLDVKDIIDNNNIELKDKYIEFIFYIMKKFDDKNAKLSDLKISNYEKILTNNSKDNNNNNNNKIKEELNIEEDKKLNEKEEKNNISNNNSNDESMTEITNEEYEKIINFCIISIQKGIKEEKTTFSKLFGDYIKKFKSEGKDVDVITIEDFNEQLKNINISLSDLQLSCICSKYSIPENVRLIKSKIVEKDITETKSTLNNKKNNNEELKDDLNDSDFEEDFEEINKKTF